MGVWAKYWAVAVYVVAVLCLITCSDRGHVEGKKPMMACLANCGDDMVSCIIKCCAHDPADWGTLVPCIMSCVHGNSKCVGSCANTTNDDQLAPPPTA